MSAVESNHYWESAVRQLDPLWVPVLDYGANGYIEDVNQHTRLVMIQSTRTVIVRDLAERRVYIVGKDVRGLFVELYRVIRGIHTAAAIESGSLPFHASAVVRDGRAICFVGRKGAGKSTALLAAATGHLDGLSILTNDKALLHAGEGLSVLAWPSVINAGAESLLALGAERVICPDFHHRYGGMAYLLLDLPLIEAVSPLPGASVPAKIRLLPEEMRRALGTSFTTEGRVVAIIESELMLDEPRSRLELVTNDDEKANLIHRNTLTDWSNHPDWLGLLTPPREHARDTSTCLENIPHDVVAAKLRVGSDGIDVTRGLVAAFTSAESPVELGATISAGPLPTYHFGVYARIVQDDALLCVRKARGPYTGQLDLPGGRPEFAESWYSALRRELAEEVATDSVVIGGFSRFSLHVDSSAAGETIDFHHHGAVADVYLRDALPDTATLSSDTNGWEWFDLRYGDWSRLSPLARSVLDK
ncbi:MULTISPECIES: NUDIX hydrolase [Actinomyces]|uniref:NUDIX domain-containing protein n=1 Tax=Actinomyces respiraculi TaxID=2744574 RepID=A0A7T0LJ93_9ACTO|nr:MULTISPECIES: NUDIX domain-containing protein [Actinomyces]QPL04662.1 NUDIX domain-containing protein [Actinomyces respiraculi]